MLVSKLYVFDCTYWIPFATTRDQKGHFGPQSLSEGSILGRKLFWSKHRHVGCPVRRNGILWWCYAITAHIEPSSWIKRPKTSFWGPFRGHKCPLRGPWECQNGMKVNEKVETTQIRIWRSFKLLFALSDHVRSSKGLERLFWGR